LINGSGTQGRSFFSNSGGVGIDFTFNSIALGFLPSRVGIVWTDGLNPITFEAFDQNGISLGTLSGMHADANFNGGTAEDRFYGVAHHGGISRIHIHNAANAGIEVDHLQYGRGVPEPGVMGLVVAVGMGLMGRKRRGECSH
jgi:hypothetical protein